jgi:hypothetical protein
VRSARVWIRLIGLTLLLGCFVVPVQAEDVEKKFRIGLGFGFLNVQDEIASDSANALNLVDSLQSPVDFYRDPRNDSAAFGNLEIKPGGIASLFAQYAVTKTFLVEASVGYQRTSVGDVEVQAQFEGIEIPDIQRFDFAIYRYEVGEIEQIPLQLTFLSRFRPRAKLNPYLGAGFGYTFVGFEPSDEFNQLSVNMDGSQGAHWRISSAFFGNETLAPTTDPIHDLDGATVEFSGTWEGHVVGGLELSFKRKWVVFLDARYTFASRNAAVNFDGGGDLGNSVPLLTDFCANPPGTVPPGGDLDTVCPGSDAGAAAINGLYGPMRVTFGGLVDGGRLVPNPGAPPGTDCSDPIDQGDCVFVLEPDGELDRGFYYAQGGSFKYDAFSLQLGVRYSF